MLNYQVALTGRHAKGQPKPLPILALKFLGASQVGGGELTEGEIVVLEGHSAEVSGMSR